MGHRDRDEPRRERHEEDEQGREDGQPALDLPAKLAAEGEPSDHPEDIARLEVQEPGRPDQDRGEDERSWPQHDRAPFPVAATPVDDAGQLESQEHHGQGHAQTDGEGQRRAVEPETGVEQGSGDGPRG